MIDKTMEHMGSPDFVTWLVKWPLPFIKLIPTNAITLIFVLEEGLVRIHDDLRYNPLQRW